MDKHRAKALRQFLLKPANLISIIVLLVFVVAAFAPDAWLPHDPLKQSLRSRFAEPAWLNETDNSYLLGADNLGRDLFSRMVRGTKTSLLISVGSVLLGAIVGCALGVIAGFRGGWLDEVIGRLADIQLAFPLVLLMITVVAALGASLTSLISVLALAAWPGYARLIRGQVLALRDLEFIEAARSLGQSEFVIAIKHLVPHTIGPMIVFTTFELSRTLLLESSLSFLGVGVPPPTPSWGAIVADGRSYLLDAWWISAFPGLAIVLVVLALNLLGDSLRDLLDPRN